MTEVLLKELSNSDIDWLLTTGSTEEIQQGTVLIRQGQPVNALHILLDGALSVSISASDENPLGRAFAALEGGEIAGREIAQLVSGEIVGEIPIRETYSYSPSDEVHRSVGALSRSRPYECISLAWKTLYLSSITVKAIEKSLILSIPQQLLINKLKKDIKFAAHLYRASAILLADRLEKIFSQLGNSTLVLGQPQLREILFVFTELWDSDIDWSIYAGRVEKIDKI